MYGSFAHVSHVSLPDISDLQSNGEKQDSKRWLSPEWAWGTVRAEPYMSNNGERLAPRQLLVP